MEDEIIDDFELNPNEVERQIIEIIEATLANKQYDEEEVKLIQNTICEKIMEFLLSSERNYKYMSKVISQLCGYGEDKGEFQQCCFEFCI